MGDVRTNATYYEDVRVRPRPGRAGERRWWLITTQLNHERIALSAWLRGPYLRDTCAWARATRLASGERVIDRPWVQLHLARVRAGLEVLRLLNWQQAWSMAAARSTTPKPRRQGVRQRVLRRGLRLLLEVMGEAGR